MPPILGQGLTDVKTRVGIEPTAAMCRRLAERGLFVGPSSGAYVHAALEIAAGGRFPTIATVISDIGECCASTGMRGGAGIRHAVGVCTPEWSFPGAVNAGWASPNETLVIGPG